MSFTDVIVGVVLISAVYLPGHALGIMLIHKGDGWSEALLLRVAASFGVLTPVATVLAVFGVFTTLNIVASMVAVALVVRAVSRRWNIPRTSRFGLWDGALFVVIGGAFALYAIPAEYVVNSRDPGVYTVVSERLAATGELFKRDAPVDAVSAFHHFFGDKKYPGFFIMEGFGGWGSLIVPQFFPGPFALLGVGVLAFGTWGGLYVVPVMGAVSVGVAFALGRELFGRLAGLFGAALMALGYTQVWWARHPSSEVMSQLLILRQDRPEPHSAGEERTRRPRPGVVDPATARCGSERPRPGDLLPGVRREDRDHGHAHRGVHVVV